jgi:serine/threonine protein kinase
VSFSLVDKQLGHYELLGGLGSGAMSEVYLARDTRLDRLVAVKVLSAQILRKADGVHRFEREAQAAARLEHPNVSTVFTSGSHEGKPYYAMELIRGWSFRELVESRVSFTLEQILPLFAQACVGLEAAFRSGVTHRDVKPGNLMVAESGQLKVVDFGLARLSDETSRRRRRGIMGTPFYLAPEVIGGADGDHRSDLYSLGVTFWEVLTGCPPFNADTPRGVLQQHIQEAAPLLSDRNPTLPSGLSRLVAEMMEKDPANRPPSFEDIHQRLRDLTGTGSSLGNLLRWCSSQQVNSFSHEGKCSLCGRPYDQRKRPETFHVDLVSWNSPDARRRAGEYIGAALGHPPETIDVLLDPLPFRAAFRARREAARRMHRDFHERGVEVMLVPADQAESKGQLPIQRLPISPAWPQTSASSSGSEWLPPGQQRARDNSPLRQTLLLTALLLVLTTGLAFSLFDAHSEVRTLRSDLAELVLLREQAAETAPSASSAIHPPRKSHWVSLRSDSPVNQASRTHVHDEITASTKELTELLPALTDHLPLEVTLVHQPIATRESPRAWTNATWAPRLEFPISGVTQVSDDQLRRMSDNLTARAMLRRAAGPSVPGWLIVGIATLREQGPEDRLAEPEDVVTEVTEVTVRAVPSAPREANERHEQVSRHFVSFLLNRGGWAALNGLVANLSAGRSPEDAVLRSFGVSLEDLELEWQDHSGESPLP